jgi:hypothetical protein
MESRFGHDFSRVRVHADARAAESARAVDAVAYTAGRDVVFGLGRYEPGCADGRRLLAHELTHVVQQRAGVRLDNGVGRADDPYERQADAVAEQVVQGRPAAASILDQQPPTAGSTLSPDSARSAATPVQRQESGESQGYGVLTPYTIAGLSSYQHESITRSPQALHANQGVYGMECFGTSVMYMIQSYGLVPPTMTRQEFEYAFTPLKPPGFDGTKGKGILVAGADTKASPVDLFTKALGGDKTKTGLTLRGFSKEGFAAKDVMNSMPAILKAFEDQSKQTGYEFMREHIPLWGTRYKSKPGEGSKPGEEWEECTKALQDNKNLGADFFLSGNTVLAGVYWTHPGVGHWVVIVGQAFVKKHRGYYVYPADDPYFPENHKVCVIAGLLSQDPQIVNGYRVYSLVEGNAYRRKLAGISLPS